VESVQRTSVIKKGGKGIIAEKSGGFFSRTESSRPKKEIKQGSRIKGKSGPGGMVCRKTTLTGKKGPARSRGENHTERQGRARTSRKTSAKGFQGEKKEKKKKQGPGQGGDQNQNHGVKAMLAP